MNKIIILFALFLLATPAIAQEPTEAQKELVEGSAASFYANYGKFLQSMGENMISIGTFLEENTKNIVEGSSDKEYVDGLKRLEIQTEKTLEVMKKIEVRTAFLEYHNLNEQALEKYLKMIKSLIKSSESTTDETKKIFLDRAALEVTEANALAGKAKEIEPTIKTLLKGYLDSSTE